jgi:hypothetical protein
MKGDSQRKLDVIYQIRVITHVLKIGDLTKNPNGNQFMLTYTEYGGNFQCVYDCRYNPNLSEINVSETK